MTVHHIRRGLDVPLAGAPLQKICDGPLITRVALVGDDFHGMRPRVRVEVGQPVRRGDALAEDVAVPGVLHTASGAGRIEAIHRGPRRVLESIVIALSDGERRDAPGDEEHARFDSYDGSPPDDLTSSRVQALLVESGLWPAFRTRPFSRVPRPGSRPAAIFVTAIDTRPLAADPDVVLKESRADLELGLRAIAKLTGGATFLCVRAGSSLATGVDAPVAVEEFAGPHPAGTAGLHIHRLLPVGRKRTVWTIGYQDVVSIGRLLATGRLDVERVVAIGGPPVANPRLVRTRLGACVSELVAGDGWVEGVRLISGSVLSGKATDRAALDFLGRYDVQVSALAEGGRREFLSWLRPGLDKFSAMPVFASRLRPRRSFSMTTDAGGSRRAIIPIGQYERVMPLDVLPTFLLRALAAGDLERAEALGCLELDEEDLALCSFVDPGKADFGPMLRRSLEKIESER